MHENKTKWPYDMIYINMSLNGTDSSGVCQLSTCKQTCMKMRLNCPLI